MATGIFEEDNGNRSEMRVMCFISLVSSIGIAAMTLLYVQSERLDIGLLLTFAFLIGAFVPKYLQKFIETKMGLTNGTSNGN